MANIVYNKGLQGILNGDFDLLTSNIRVALVTSSYTANKDDDFYDDGGANDVIDHELSGTGYTAKGELLGTKAVTMDDANDRAEFDAANSVWSGINAGTAAAAVVYYDSGVATTSHLIAYIDQGGFPIVTNGGDLTINWNAEGILQIG